MEDIDFNAAHRCSTRHREQVLASERCGCFYCCSTFTPADIIQWIDDGQTALCPLCGIDAVIGSASGFPLTAAFLRLMEAHYFGGEHPELAVVKLAQWAMESRVNDSKRPLLFLTISGAHLYGFPSEDSDIDLRGVHILPGQELLGLGPAQETIEWAGLCDGREIDLVTHDARKFFLMLLKPNGYVLEQLYSPLVVHTTPEHAELKDIARRCVTRRHAEHYLGFFRTQWSLFEKDRRIKPLLYAYRVLLTGIHLMRTGEIEADLERLIGLFRLPHLKDLVLQKAGGLEDGRLQDADASRHQNECELLRTMLEDARAASGLPESPTARPALEDLLLRLRRAATG